MRKFCVSPLVKRYPGLGTKSSRRIIDKTRDLN